MKTVVVIRQAQREAFVTRGDSAVISRASVPCMRLVSDNGSAVILAGQRGAPGKQGPIGPAGPASGTGFTWTQSIPLATWTIPHNLQRFPSVTVVDAFGAKVEPDVTYTDENIIQILHGLPFSGLAYLN